MAKKMAQTSRRALLITGALGAMALTPAVRAQDDSNLKLLVLIAALRSVGGQVCLRQADVLEESQASSHYDLHLRRADLSAQQAENIAAAINTEWSEQKIGVRSFSMSFNPGLSDAGAISIASALPSSVTEVGLVGCAIGDEGGGALLSWAKQAPELRLICVEDNHLSLALREKFSALGRLSAKLQVVV